MKRQILIIFYGAYYEKMVHYKKALKRRCCICKNETMHIGYVLNENQELSELGKSYLEELRKYAPANP